MAERDDIVLGISVDPTRAVKGIDEVRDRLNALEKSNTPFSLAFKTTAASKELSNFVKEYDQYQAKLKQDLRSPSKGGLPKDQFRQEYGMTKVAGQDTLKQAEQQAVDSYNNQAQAAGTAFSQIAAKAQARSAQEANAINKVRAAEQQLKNERNSSIEGYRGNVSRLSNIELPSLRYALYDVAGTASVFNTAIAGLGAATIGFAAKYESAFTDVERTTLASGRQLEQIRTQLISLSEAIPVGFTDLAGIASLGAQLGLASEDLVGFAETVSKFSAATNVSIEAAAMGFGTLGELLNVAANEYQNLGSAIAFVGVNSVATETQILSVAESIGGVANSAGLSAEYVIGLSGALASLKVPAEQSRGALTRIFSEVNRSVSGVGVDLQLFADVLGVTAGEAQRLATSDMEEFFSRFVEGLSRVNSTDLTGLLDQLQLSDIRVTNVLTRLSRNTERVSESLADANSAFADGTFLNEVYALRVDDLSSKIQILQNSLTNLAAATGTAFEPVIKDVVDNITSFIQTFRSAIGTEAGGFFLDIASKSALLAFAISGLVQVVGLFIASLGAVRFSLKTLGWETSTNGVARFTAAMFGATAATGGFTVAANVARIALIGIPILGLVAGLVSLALAFDQASASADASFSKYITNTAGLSEAIQADTLAQKNGDLTQSFVNVKTVAVEASDAQIELANQYANSASIVGTNVTDAYKDATAAVEGTTIALGENTLAWFQNAVMQSDSLREVIGTDEFVQQWGLLGANFQQVTANAAANGEAGVREYFIRLTEAAITEGRITIAQLSAISAQAARALSLGGAARIASGDKAAIKTYANLWLGANSSLNTVIKTAGGFGNQLRTITGGTTDANKELKGMGENADGAAESLSNLGRGAGSAAKQVRTLKDYASDLAEVFNRAYEIRFSSGDSLDKITSSFQKIAQATDDAREQINSLNADIQKLQADRALQEYFLQVAEAYGDTLKAQEIRANLAKIDSDLTKKTKDLGKAQDKTNKTLVGNSEAAIENRGEIRGLVKSYQDHIKALADSGLSQDALKIKTAELKADFIAQATQLGYNTEELGLYSAAFDDVTVAIGNIPRNITVEANTDPALQALNEFVAKAKSAVGGGVNVPITGSYDRTAAIQAAQDALRVAEAWRLTLLAQRNFSGADAAEGRLAGLRAKLAEIRGYATGGFVNGPGGSTSDSIPAMLSKGEYVVKAAAVDRYGVGFFDRLNQMRAPSYFSGQAAQASGVSVVALSPEDRALLRNVGGSGEVVLYADNQAIARSANAGNKAIVAAGGRP